jgi:hypothetical protein
MRLLARRVGATPPRWTARELGHEFAGQLRLQAPGVILVPLAALFAVPFGWTYAYFQTATVLPGPAGEGLPRRAQAWDLAGLWPKQNHCGLAVLLTLWLMVFLNLAVAFYVVPALATRWLGLDTAFALSGWSYFNTTFLVLVAMLTHLLVDPLIKTFYLLRVFHGQARTTGADLRLALAGEKLRRRGFAAGAALVALVAWLAPAPAARAAQPGPATPAIRSAPVPALNAALDRVLQGAEFRWRLRPLAAPVGAVKEGLIQGFFRATFETLQQMVRTVFHWIEQAYRWISRIFPDRKPDPADAGDAAGAGARNPYRWMEILQLTAGILLVAVLGLLIFAAWKLWQHNRATKPEPAAVGPGPEGVPDLRDESIQASRLPADGWLDLARQQLAAGEWRLALRALFLATLARHAHAGLVSLAKYKTNLDYERELVRRAYSRTALVEDFRGRRRQFEEVWYGASPASDRAVRDWLQRMEEAA